MFCRGLNANTTTTTTTTNITLAPKGDVEYYIAAYPYESAEIGDLTFSAGEMIVVTKKDGDWWTGNIGNRSGMFPSNYVQKADVGSNEQQAATGRDNQLDNGKVCKAIAIAQSSKVKSALIKTPIANDANSFNNNS